MGRSLIIGTGVGIALAASLATAIPALAECSGQTNEFPPYTEVAPTAERVVIGEVVENLSVHTGAVASFRFRVDEVLRGEAPPSMVVTDLKSGLPLQGSPACRGDAKIYARVGDVLALAFRGRFAGVDGVNTAAWIEGRPPAIGLKGAEVLTLAQARRSAEALPPTDATEAPRGDADISAQVWPIAALVALFAGVLVTRRRRSTQQT